MGFPAGTAGLKRHTSITMELAARTISPQAVPDISRYADRLLLWPVPRSCMADSESRSVRVPSESARVYRDRPNPIMMLIDGWLVTTYN